MLEFESCLIYHYEVESLRHVTVYVYGNALSLWNINLLLGGLGVWGCGTPLPVVQVRIPTEASSVTTAQYKMQVLIINANVREISWNKIKISFYLFLLALESHLLKLWGKKICNTYSGTKIFYSHYDLLYNIYCNKFYYD